MADARSSIGRAVAGGIQSIGQGLIQRAAMEQEEERVAEAKRAADRAMGIVQRSELRTTPQRVEAPTATLPGRPQSAISRAAGTGPTYTSAGADSPSIQTPAPTVVTRPEAPRTIRGAATTVMAPEEHIDLGDGSVYVPGRDRQSLIAAQQATATTSARLAAEQAAKDRQRQQTAQILQPVIARIRERSSTGDYDPEDLWLLAQHGVELKDIENPASVISRNIDSAAREATATTTARRTAETPFDIEEEERAAEREAEETQARHNLTLAEIGARAEAERGNIDHRAATEARTGTEGGSKAVNYKTDPRFAPVYGLAMAQIQSGARDGTPATLPRIIGWLTDPRISPRTSRLPHDHLIAIAAQAWRDATGQMDMDAAGGGAAGTIDTAALARMLEATANQTPTQ